MSDAIFRRARVEDVSAIVALLADDILGATRETAGGDLPVVYLKTFAEIDADPNQFLCVVEDCEEVVGTLQLTFIPGLARNGAKRGQIEAVRIASNRRGEQLGEALFAWAIAKCQEQNCSLVQLTTDKARPDAHRFYDRLGFEASHLGYKRLL